MDIKELLSHSEEIKDTFTNKWFLTSVGIVSLVILLTPKNVLGTLLSVSQISALQQVALLIVLGLSAVLVLQGISSGYDLVSGLFSRNRKR